MITTGSAVSVSTVAPGDTAMSQSLGYENRCPSSGFVSLPGDRRRRRRSHRPRGGSRRFPRGGDARLGPGDDIDRRGAQVGPRGIPEGKHHDHREGGQGERDACHRDRTASGRGAGKRSQRAERWRRNRFQRIRSSSSRSSRRSSARQQPPRRRVHSPPRWPSQWCARRSAGSRRCSRRSVSR